MLLNFKFSLKKDLATIATIASIFASLAVTANNTAQFIQHVEPYVFPKSSRLLKSEPQTSQQPYSSEGF